MNSLPDWKLPAGTSRGILAYTSDVELARNYDARLAGTPLLQYDLRFAERFLTPPGKLIDLGCGTGRLLLPFAQLGYSVVGVDLSEEMLRVAAEKFRAAGLAVPLIRANLVELDGFRDEVFDYAVCLFSTLGMIIGAEYRRQMLAHVHRLLKPDGRFVLHVHNRGFHIWTQAGRRWLVQDTLRRWRKSEDAGDFEMPHHDGIAGLALHHFSRNEIERELNLTGFRILAVEPVSTRPDCQSRLRWLAARWRAYGYLIAAERT
jgi:ubiquinone/menaquinone biosynthesis C-methylase UbiE